MPQEAQVFLARPLAVEGKACQLHEKGFDLAGKRVSRVGEGRRNQHAIIFQYPFYLLQGVLRLRHDVQRVGHDHYIKGLVRIGQAEHILHGEVQLGRAAIPLRLGDHLRGGIRRLDVRRRVYDVFCDQSRAGGQLQHRFCFHHRPDELIHLVICRPILLHKVVVTSGISVPEGLSFFHSRCPYLFFVSLPPCVSQQDFTAPLNLPMRASVPPLPGVFQQRIARRAKRPAPCPMYAPAIPAYHEGNGFDLLFLVQAPISFLFYMQLVTSNRLPEEKAGHLYAVCLLSDAKARSRARLTAPGRARCRPVPSARC